MRETKGNFLDEAVTLQIRGPTSPANVGFWPNSDRIQRPLFRATSLHLGLLCHFERIIDFDAEIANGAFQFAVTKQQLHGAKILCSPIDQCRFGSPHRVGSVADAASSIRQPGR